MLYLWYGVVLRLKVHPREQMAQKKRSSRKSLSLIFTFTKKLLIKSGTCVGHLNTVWYWGRKFKRNNLQKFKCPGGSWNWSTQFLSLRWTDESLTRKLILLRLRVWYPLFPERSFLTHRSFSSRRANVVATVGKWTLTSRHGWSAKLSVSPSTVSRFFTKII